MVLSHFANLAPHLRHSKGFIFKCNACTWVFRLSFLVKWLPHCWHSNFGHTCFSRPSFNLTLCWHFPQFVLSLSSWWTSLMCLFKYPWCFKNLPHSLHWKVFIISSLALWLGVSSSISVRGRGVGDNCSVYTTFSALSQETELLAIRFFIWTDSYILILAKVYKYRKSAISMFLIFC